MDFSVVGRDEVGPTDILQLGNGVLRNINLDNQPFILRNGYQRLPHLHELALHHVYPLDISVGGGKHLLASRLVVAFDGVESCLAYLESKLGIQVFPFGNNGIGHEP